MLPESFGFGMLGVSVNFTMPPMSCGEYVLTVKVRGHVRMMTVTMKQAHDAWRLSKSAEWMPVLMAGLMTIVADQPLVSLN